MESPCRVYIQFFDEENEVKKLKPEEKHSIKQYSHSAIHNILVKINCKNDDIPIYAGKSAMICPYYVNLEGCLGMDWGVIVNPESKKFGQLVFEHDWCGCEDKMGELLQHDKDYQEIEDAWEEK